MDVLTFLIYAVLSILVGLFFIGSALNIVGVKFLAIPGIDFVYSQLSLMRGDFWASLLIGLIVIFFFIRFVEVLLRRSYIERPISLETTEGRVHITLSAVEDMLRRMLEEYEELARVKTKVIPRKNSIDVMIGSDLASEVNIRDFTAEVQGRIKKKLQNLLGEDKEVNIKIDIRKVVYRSKKLGRSDDDRDVEIPFRNY